MKENGAKIEQFEKDLETLRQELISKRAERDYNSSKINKLVIAMQMKGIHEKHEKVISNIQSKLIKKMQYREKMSEEMNIEVQKTLDDIKKKEQEIEKMNEDLSKLLKEKAQFEE